MNYATEVEAVSTWVDLCEIADSEGCELSVVVNHANDAKMFLVTVNGQPDDHEYYETLEGVAGFFRGLSRGRASVERPER